MLTCLCMTASFLIKSNAELANFIPGLAPSAAQPAPAKTATRRRRPKKESSSTTPTTTTSTSTTETKAAPSTPAKQSTTTSAKKPATKASVPAKAPAKAATTTATSVGAGEEDDNEKIIRKVKKALRQIEELESAKAAGGKELSAAEIEKISKKASLTAQLAAATAAIKK
jgi:hypothetical protein